MEGSELILGRSRSLDCQRKTPDLGVPEFSVIPRVHVAHAKADFSEEAAVGGWARAARTPLIKRRFNMA